MEYSSRQGVPRAIDELQSKLEADGYTRKSTSSAKNLEPGEYLRHDFTGDASSFEGPAQSRIEWCVRR